MSNIGFKGEKKEKKANKNIHVKIVLFVFYFFHKGTHKWSIYYEKRERTFQNMTWRTLEQYSAGKCDTW